MSGRIRRIIQLNGDGSANLSSFTDPENAELLCFTICCITTDFILALIEVVLDWFWLPTVFYLDILLAGEPSIEGVVNIAPFFVGFINFDQAIKSVIAIGDAFTAAYAIPISPVMALTQSPIIEETPISIFGVAIG